MGADTDESIVEVPTKTHIRYRFEILKWLLGQRGKPEPLYVWAEGREER